MKRVIEVTTNSPRETLELGRLLGQRLRSGDIVTLDGPLGAGKTQFVKGMAVGLGVAAHEPVVSPTFVLVREYVGKFRLYHLDAYRLRSADDLANLGFDELQDEKNVVVAIEWAKRVPAIATSETVHVEIEHLPPAPAPGEPARSEPATPTSAAADSRRIRMSFRDSRRRTDIEKALTATGALAAG